MDLVKSLCEKEGIIVMAAIHDLNLAARYCNTAILLNKGKIFSAGPLDEVLTSENIKSVFKVDAIVKKNLVTNSLYIIPLSPPKSSPLKNCAIHLICGAGTGTALMKILLEEGYSITTGVLNVLDTDFETAEFLNIPVTSEAAKEALMRGIPVFVIDEVPIESRDFTKGRAIALFEDLKSMGAIFVKNQDELLHMLNVSEEKLKMAKDALPSIADHLKAGRVSQESQIGDKNETGKIN
jgi:iron complex transport system ATP-binding protein